MLLMLPVLTLLVTSSVPVTQDTLEMALSVWVSTYEDSLLYHRLAPLVIDLDECATSMDNCAADATCTNTPTGNFTCTCNPGYTGDGTVCMGKYVL